MSNGRRTQLIMKIKISVNQKFAASMKSQRHILTIQAQVAQVIVTVEIITISFHDISGKKCNVHTNINELLNFMTINFSC